jgi:hypothetical protein
MKKVYFVIGIIFLLLVAWVFIRFVIGGNEDSWIKNEKGVYVKHGNPSETPQDVTEQEAAITCAYGLFDAMTEQAVSQCLGTCMSYAVDIVHVPRTAKDDLVENQCEDYGNGFVNHFIELDKNREIVRII